MADEKPSSTASNISTGSLTTWMNRNTITYLNVKQEVIVITKDKTELYLTKYIEKSSAKMAWITPLLLLLTLIWIPVTAKFQNTFKVSANTWQAICYILIIGCILWLIWTLKRAYEYSNINVDFILKKFIEESIVATEPVTLNKD